MRGIARGGISACLMACKGGDNNVQHLLNVLCTRIYAILLKLVEDIL
jgi:hypothetical protein